MIDNPSPAEFASVDILAAERATSPARNENLQRPGSSEWFTAGDTDSRVITLSAATLQRADVPDLAEQVLGHVGQSRNSSR